MSQAAQSGCRAVAGEEGDRDRARRPRGRTRGVFGGDGGRGPRPAGAFATAAPERRGYPILNVVRRESRSRPRVRCGRLANSLDERGRCAGAERRPEGRGQQGAREGGEGNFVPVAVAGWRRPLSRYPQGRSGGRRGGKACVGTGRSRGWRYSLKKKIQ